MALPVIFGVGGIFAVVIEWFAKLFSKSRFFRILLAIGMMELLYLTLNNGIQFFITYLTSKLTTLNLPPEICWTLSQLDFFNILSFYISVLISFAFMKYFLRMSERLL